MFCIVSFEKNSNTGSLQAEMNVWRPLVNASLSCDLRVSAIGGDPG